MKRAFLCFAATALVLGLARSSEAVPILQLYVEGATYDNSTETWVLTGGGTIRLWTIGNVAGPGGAGTIEDVKLSIAYAAGATPTFSLTPTTTNGYGGFADPSTAAAPTLLQTRTDGSTPLLGGGAPLPSHGEYGPETWWQEFLLGDFNRTDSHIADFIDGFPTVTYANAGQINVYEISVANFEGTIHFDLYDHVMAGNKAKYKFAPFSHDAEAGSPIPEPGTLALFGAGIAASIAKVRARRSRIKI